MTKGIRIQVEHGHSIYDAKTVSEPHCEIEKPYECCVVDIKWECHNSMEKVDCGKCMRMDESCTRSRRQRTRTDVFSQKVLCKKSHVAQEQRPRDDGVASTQRRIISGDESENSDDIQKQAASSKRKTASGSENERRTYVVPKPKRRRISAGKRMNRVTTSLGPLVLSLGEAAPLR